MRSKAKRLKVKEAADELNVHPRTVHNRIRTYAANVDKSKDGLLPSTPTNGLRGIPGNKSRSGRITWSINSRDLADYLENGERELLGLNPRNWRLEE